MISTNFIAVSGLKNSGKDTAAQMLQYLLNAPRWAKKYWCYKYLRFLGKFGTWKVKSFAHPIKAMLSVLLNVPIKRFENRDFKDNYYVEFPTLAITEKRNVPKDKILNKNKFNKLAKTLDPDITESYWLSIRQLMQFFGTEVMRTYFGNDLWIWSTLTENNIVVSDLRFKIEMMAIRRCSSKVIYIDRDVCESEPHSSESEVIDMKNENCYDYIIENNSSLKDLFDKLAKIV